MTPNCRWDNAPVDVVLQDDEIPIDYRASEPPDGTPNPDVWYAAQDERDREIELGEWRQWRQRRWR